MRVSDSSRPSSCRSLAPALAVLALAALALAACAGDKSPTFGERIASFGDAHGRLADEWNAAHEMKQRAEDDIRAARKALERAEEDLEDAEKRREKGIAGMVKTEAEFHRRFPGQIMDK